MSDESDPPSDPGPTSEETEKQRLNRNFNEQLQEVRIAQAGVQILFAFLLSIAFQQTFQNLTTLQRGIYVVTLICSALAVICFTAPVATHRLLFREGAKAFIVGYTDRLAAAGLLFLGLSILGGVVLAIDVLLSHGWAIAIGLALATVAAVLWVVIPQRHKVNRGPLSSRIDR